MRLALLFQDRNFVGREYFLALDRAGMRPNLVIAAGRMKDDSIAREVARTGGLWNPPDLPSEQPVHRFDKVKDPALWDLLRASDIDVAIQGGMGATILTPDMLSIPRICFLNVHPGKLPQYRGSSCPEWALWNGDDIWATAHVMDAGLDTGPVICEQPYRFAPNSTYAQIRAGLYAHCARVLVEALSILGRLQGAPVSSVTKVQDEALACQRQAMPPEQLAQLINRLDTP